MDGGIQPQWSADGSRLYFLGPTHLMQVEIEFDATFRPQTPVTLFELEYMSASRSYAVAEGGERFLMIKPSDTADNAQPASVVIMQNWTEVLGRLVPTE